MPTLLLETQLAAYAKALRVHCLKATTQAGSGHPTSCLSAADLVSALFYNEFRFDLENPDNPNNDRFVLSKGHAAPLLYAAWALAGALPLEKLLTLRQFNSDLEGHPTPRFPLAEVSAGSLGQGLSMGAGMALSGRLDHSDSKVYVLLGDGEVAEGSVWEAAAFANYHKLNNLIGILDANDMGQSQRTMHTGHPEAYKNKFEAFGWKTFLIDGHNMTEIVKTLEAARQVTDKPVMIVAKTLKGKGISFIENKDGWHGKPLKKEELELALKELDASGADPIETPVALKKPKSSGSVVSVSNFSVAAPQYAMGASVATREAYGTALAKLGAVCDRVVSLDGDTKNSTFAEVFMKAYPQRFFEGFIAEQNMVGAAVGLARRGKIPFVSTFGAFMARAFDFIRMAAIARANIKLVGSHAGISIGEDGPSQMALEDLAMMRAIPHAAVLYPCDAVSTERLVEEAAKYQGVVYIRTSRPKTPVVYSNDEKFPIGGCKVLRQSKNDKLTVVAAGVTVFEALKAYEALLKDGISICVVDAYSIKPFDENTIVGLAAQTNQTVVTVEDHYGEGGLGDAVLAAVAHKGIWAHKLAVTEIPRSGTSQELLDAYGISARRIVDFVKKI